jgi:hypothetical protein
MDRRRRLPAPEGLEGRALLSLFGSNSNNILHNPVQDIPATYQQKELRVEHLPYYLNQLQPGRFLSKPDLEQLQADLLDVTTELHKPPPATLLQFNRLMRDLEPQVSLSTENAQKLNGSFGLIVSNMGATTQQASNLQEDMNNLALVDSHSRNPSFLASNDYSTVLQTVLAIGRPIARPEVPFLSELDGSRPKPGYGIAHNPTPSLVGQYGVGGTVGVFGGDVNGGFNSKGDIIQVLNAEGQVIGSGPVNAKNGNYRAKITTPLADGIYVVYVRAVDPLGHMSEPSNRFHLKIISRRGEVVTGQPTPHGPQSLA